MLAFGTFSQKLYIKMPYIVYQVIAEMMEGALVLVSSSVAVSYWSYKDFQ